MYLASKGREGSGDARVQVVDSQIVEVEGPRLPPDGVPEPRSITEGLNGAVEGPVGQTEWALVVKTGRVPILTFRVLLTTQRSSQ